MNVVEIIFSPTGGTEKVAHIIGGHWSENVVKIDLSDSKIDFTKCKISKDDMVLIAMPSFGGRAPAVAIERLKKIAGNAANRPDVSDERQLVNFADQIAGKTGEVVSIPGNRPYKKGGGAGLVPKPTKDCVKCGLCADKCPVKAIDLVSFAADSKKCISCMRCIKQCPHNARKVNGAVVSIAAMAIKKACSVRKENELFL